MKDLLRGKKQLLQRGGLRVFGGARNLRQTILALPGLIAYWPLDELAGTVADNAEGTAARDGTYAGSIPLAQVAFPSGGSSPNYQDADDNITVYGTSLANAWSWQNGWMLIWYKQSVEGKSVSVVDNLGAVTLNLTAHKSDGSSSALVSVSNPAKSVLAQQRHSDWTMLAATWSTENNQFIGYLQGSPVGLTQTYTGAGTILTSGFALGRLNGFRGGIAHVACGAGSVPTLAQIDAVYKAAYPSTHRAVFVCGDSWATENDYWIDTIVSSLRTADSNAWREQPYRLGYSGQRIAYIHAQLDATLPGLYATTPNYILMAGCANDITGDTAETPFKADFAGSIDALRSKWPGVPIYCHHPYRDDLYNGAYDTKSLAIKQWQLDVIATYASGVYPGPDGNVWFKTNIDTWSSDRIHPTEDAGRVEFAAQWMSILGY